MTAIKIVKNFQSKIEGNNSFWPFFFFFNYLQRIINKVEKIVRFDSKYYGIIIVEIFFFLFNR